MQLQVNKFLGMTWLSETCTRSSVHIIVYSLPTGMRCFLGFKTNSFGKLEIISMSGLARNYEFGCQLALNSDARVVSRSAGRALQSRIGILLPFLAQILHFLNHKQHGKSLEYYFECLMLGFLSPLSCQFPYHPGLKACVNCIWSIRKEIW